VSAAEHESQARADDANRRMTDAQAERDELLWLMSDKRGRRLMWRLLTRAGIYRTSFTGDALTSAFREGAKQEGLHQMTLITQHCQPRFIEMQKEARTHERRNDRSTTSQPGT
jgi:hypothetical protein